MSSEFKALLSEHVGNAFAKQLAFADVLGDRNWGVDISAGRVMFGNDLSYPIQLLGTEAAGDASWLWAWANQASNLPPALLRTCTELKDIGEARRIPELVDRSYSLEVANGHAIALVASGLNPACCYYRGPYDGGALFFLVCDAPVEVTGQVAPERAITVITQAISQFEVDHRPMATSFLQKQGFNLEINEQSITATRNNQTVTLSFDSLGRINNVEGKLSPSPHPQKSRWQFWK
ncbi:MAG: DUF6882 domain-containing protein [Cyanobacteria bacterium J06626_14]